MIQKLLINLNNHKEIKESNIFEKLDIEYEILNLIINDLIRYTNIIKELNISPESNAIYEGIYSYKDNIEQRLQILFFFAKGNKTNKGLKLNSIEHLERIYSIFKSENFHNDLINFFSIFLTNINFIPNPTLEEFLYNIIENENEFDLSSFSEESILLFIQKIFLKINTSEDIITFDSKVVRVKKENIKKLDLLFDIMGKNLLIK